MQVLRISGIYYNFLAPDTVVLFHEFELIHYLLFQEAGIARFIDFNLTHHLTNDNFKVLIVNLHTLQTINVLYFVYDIFLYSRRTFNGKDIGRSNGTVGQRSTGTHVVVLLYQYLFGQRYEIFLNFSGLRGNDNFAVTTFHLTHCDLTVNFGNHSRIGRVTCLEQFGNTGKTTRDITRLTNGTRNLHDYFTGFYLLSVFHYYVTTHRKVIGTDKFAIFSHDVRCRHFRLVLRLNDDDFAQTGRFIGLYLIGNVFNNAFKLNLTGSFGNDNCVERVPTGYKFAFLYYFTIRCIECRTIRHVMRRKYDTCIDIYETYFCQTAYYHLSRFACFVNNIYCTEFFKFQTGRILGNNTCISSDIGCRTTGMERTQRQLCTWLTDRLRSDYTDSFTFLNHTACSQITAVALGTNTLLGFTSQYRTDFNALNRRVFNLLCNGFSDFFTTCNKQFTGCGVNDIMYGYTSQNTFVQCSDCLIVILQSCTNQSAKRTAVFFVDNHIVRYVNQTTGQVSGIGRLQSGIGKTLTSTVSRDKVLQHGKTFLKVRKNRVLDNLTAFGTCLLRFRHQTTHTGKLTNLLLRTTGSRIQHHVYGIESLIVARNSFHQNV